MEQLWNSYGTCSLSFPCWWVCGARGRTRRPWQRDFSRVRVFVCVACVFVGHPLSLKGGPHGNETFLLPLAEGAERDGHGNVTFLRFPLAKGAERDGHGNQTFQATTPFYPCAGLCGQTAYDAVPPLRPDCTWCSAISRTDCTVQCQLVSLKYICCRGVSPQPLLKETQRGGNLSSGLQQMLECGQPSRKRWANY